MNIKGSVLTAVTAILLVGCSGSERNTPQLDIKDGVYWSERYQSYLVVDDAVITRYQWTPSQCWAADAGLMPRVFSSKFNPGQHAWVGAGYRTLVLQRLSDGLPVVFTREPFLPKHCTQKPESGAQQVVDTLAELLQQFHHGLSQTALLRWQYEAQRIDAIESDVPFDDQVALFALVSEVLEDSNDEHAFILAQGIQRYYRVSDFEVGEAQREQARRQLLQDLQTSRLNHGCEQALWWGLLNTGEYYLGVQRLHRFSPEASYSEPGQRCLQRALYSIEEDLKGVAQVTGAKPKLLIDLRYNEGGSLLLASQLANSLVNRDEALTTIQGFSVFETRRPDLSALHQRGTVLVTEVTASAAEHLAQALRLRGFLLRGQKTRGAFSPTTVKSLPNGWIVGLSMYAPDAVVDGRGAVLPEGEGLTPDENLPIEVLFPTEPAQD
ncbi:hypothetical protein EGC76_02160 [Pseudidiomarina gelatinasegens]|uniref:Tail specific protease domain-containing protein n=1 Tax=Pseudidiomarina gelatinasegens TaxID=2487740 RepID=A0A443Z7X8_9GAMM|nr:S41 family peptidase [Pseudidiomarina gelatinasegens]RWU13043.1 hypothetical protein EGC76_02160 [Pseudidiomarina gelatinasegens]